MSTSKPRELKSREFCPVCASTATTSLLRLPYDEPPIANFIATQYGDRAELGRLAGETFEVEECGGCGVIFQKNVPLESLLQDLYDVWIPPSERERLRKEAGISDFRYLAGQVEFLIQYFKAKPYQISVFDFGLGWCEWASIAQSYGCDVSGSELSVERIENAESRGIRMVDWDDIPNQRFHFINTEQVFEHLIDPRETLTHLVRGLREDGIIKISVPDGRGMRARLRKLGSLPEVSRDYIMPVQPLEHVNCFDHRSLVELGRQAGLKVMRPSLRLLYNGSSGWLEPRQGLKNLLRPIYRHIYPKSTFIYFSRAGG